MKPLTILKHNEISDYEEWTAVGKISVPEFYKLDNTNSTLKWFRKNGFLDGYRKGHVKVKDNGAELILLERVGEKIIYLIPYS